jgi:hypothetical protein
MGKKTLNDLRKKENVIQYIKNGNQPITLADIAARVPNKNWYSNIYDKINGVETIVAYASFNSTNLLSMYGDRLVKSLELLENGDFEIYLKEEI